MSNQSAKLPPALVVVDGELFHAFDRWRTMQGYELAEMEGTDGLMLRLRRRPDAGDEAQR